MSTATKRRTVKPPLRGETKSHVPLTPDDYVGSPTLGAWLRAQREDGEGTQEFRAWLREHVTEDMD